MGNTSKSHVIFGRQWQGHLMCDKLVLSTWLSFCGGVLFFCKHIHTLAGEELWMSSSPAYVSVSTEDEIIPLLTSVDKQGKWLLHYWIHLQNNCPHKL